MYFVVFIFGVSIGSFLNVLIDRLPRNESFFGNRSYCEFCKKTLRWYDMVPLLSYILLKGRCRYCKSSLSLYYPIVELTTGVVFVLVYFFLNSNFGFNFYDLGSLTILAFYLFIASGFIVIFFTDLKFGIIPDKIVFPSIIASIFYLFINHNSLIINHFGTAVISFLAFLILFLATKGSGIGFGDVKLVFLMGLILGWPDIIVALYFAFLTGAAVGIILILWGRKRLRGDSIPFGPFLAIGTILAIFFKIELFLKLMLDLA